LSFFRTNTTFEAQGLRDGGSEQPNEKEISDIMGLIEVTKSDLNDQQFEQGLQLIKSYIDITSIKPMMSDISFSFGCSDPACTDTGCSSHIMAFGGMLMVFVVTLEILKDFNSLSRISISSQDQMMM
jgi:hypothetical protein